MNKDIEKINYLIMKRIIDVIGAIALVIIFLPLLFVIPLLVRKDGGPALFTQERIGKDGKVFKIYKFRSMVAEAEKSLDLILKEDLNIALEWERTHKIKNDPRITKIGQLLRKTSLDELPQLINVLKGEMSLVGPRPIVAAEIEKYGAWFGLYSSMTPGLTGLWQVTGRNDISYPRRVALDRKYYKSRGFFVDLAILVKTPWMMFAKTTGH